MARTRVIQHAMTSGEFSPLLNGRTDLAKYVNALQTCENFIVLKTGGVNRRPGTHYVSTVKDSTKQTTLLPFQFSSSQAYIIEAGNLYFRFYKNSARIESPPGTPVEIVTPYAHTDVFDLQYVQSADVIYIVHSSYPPKKLARTSDIAWTLSTINFIDGPYFPDENNLTGFNVKVSANTGTGLTMTASSAIFLARHVGSVWRVKGITTWGWVRITAFTDTTHVTVDVGSPLDFAVPGTDTTIHWLEGEWSGVRGYPSSVTLFQQRLWFGNTNTEPDSFWGSVTASYEDFSPGTATDSDSTDYTLASNAVNAIQWMVPSRELLIGTMGQEWQVTSAGGVITPSDADAKPETTYGSTNVLPVQTHNAALFLQRSGKVLRELSFDFNTDSYVAPDMTILASHLTKDYGIVQMAYQQIPDSIVWAVRADGTLLGMTYERPQDVVAWHRHIVGGTYNDGTGAVDAKVVSVASIPHPDGDRDQLWVISHRLINGSLVKYVEYLQDKDAELTALNVDAGIITSLYVSGTTTVTGLSHLEGQTVDILASPFTAGNPDAAVYPQKIVSGGQITGLDPPIYSAEIGLHFESTIKTMKPELLTGKGTTQAARQRWNEIIIRVYNSLGGTVNGDDLSLRDPATPMTSGSPLFTGDIRKTQLGWDKDGSITVMQTQPLPLTLLAIIGVINTED